jgi:hypothetical protein
VWQKSVIILWNRKNGGNMGLLDNDIVDRLRIRRMIFHVVGPAEDDLVLMDEVDVSGFEAFFLARIRETNIGNRFEFIGPDQGVRRSLGSMNADPDRFVQSSKEVAESFHINHRATSSRGAFIIAELTGAGAPAFALIKFDDQTVLSFRQEQTADGGMRAVVSSVDNTFIEDRKAMQKSALVCLTDDGGSLAVFDRANQRNITDYFKAFLGVRRLWTPKEATTRLKRALDAAFQANRDEAPNEVRQSWRHRLHGEVQQRETVGPEGDLEAFGAAVFGPFWHNENFRNDVARELHKSRISGEVIEIDRAVIPAPTRRRIKTHEDVVISYPRQLDDAENIVQVQPRAGGGSVITITTQGIVDNELVDESAARRTTRAG